MYFSKFMYFCLNLCFLNVCCCGIPTILFVVVSSLILKLFISNMFPLLFYTQPLFFLSPLRVPWAPVASQSFLYIWSVVTFVSFQSFLAHFFFFSWMTSCQVLIFIAACLQKCIFVSVPVLAFAYSLKPKSKVLLSFFHAFIYCYIYWVSVSFVILMFQSVPWVSVVTAGPVVLYKHKNVNCTTEADIVLLC